jgi:hypothetical protein
MSNFNWRKHLRVHPAADLFPEMAGDELEDLAGNIRQHGLQVPLITFNDQLLDGRNRLNAAAKEGLLHQREGQLCLQRSDGKVDPIPVCVAQGDPYEIVVALNIHRRHLTPEQRRELIAKVIEANSKRSDRQIAKMVKRDHKTVADVREKMEDVGRIPHVAKRTDTKGRKQPSTKPKTPKATPAPAPPTAKMVPPKIPAPATDSRPRSVSAEDIALKGFTNHAMELVRLTRNKSADRFAKTALPDWGIEQLAKLFSDLAKIRCRASSAEVSVEQRFAAPAEVKP